MSSVIVVNRENHRVERRAGTVVAKIWRRPDLSREEGANLAELLQGTLIEEAARSSAMRLVFDLSEAHSVWGPRTHQALVAMFGAWKGKSIVMIAPEAITRIGLQQVCKAAGVTTGRVVRTVKEVENYE
jgi:hypothetical protein